MAVWRVLLNVSLADLPLNGVTGIDASGFERAHASTHYTKRTNLTIQQLKTTLLVDTATNAILDVHVTTTRKHDTQIAPQIVKRNGQSISVLTGDKGYDDQKLRRLTHDHDIRPLIKHREFTPLHKSWNARLDSDLYHRRNMNETVNAAIKQKFGAFGHAFDGSSSANSSSSVSFTIWSEASPFHKRGATVRDSERN
ncbi:hypothetical protein GCM10027355_23790 [Haloplanus salinarum]